MFARTCITKKDSIFKYFLLCAGWMGRSPHDQHGGGVNYLCLPTDPEFRADVQEGHQSHSYIKGVEYQKEGSQLFAAVHDHDAPCAVCEVQGRSAVLMIAAKQTCPDGWTLEYDGLLAAEKHDHRSGSDFVCVSSGMESRPGGNGDANGGLLYVVEAQCGSLPCGPYTNGYEITCVVCTK